MDPFDIKEKENINLDEEDIIIKIPRHKGKYNTFISGWNIPLEEIKEHIKTIKRALGCNGSVKKNEDIYTIQFQGSHEIYIREYLEKQGVDKNNITLQG
jgi:translation initiation factor 1 (eIF-1/SUI1)